MKSRFCVSWFYVTSRIYVENSDHQIQNLLNKYLNFKVISRFQVTFATYQQHRKIEISQYLLQTELILHFYVYYVWPDEMMFHAMLLCGLTDPVQTECAILRFRVNEKQANHKRIAAGHIVIYGPFAWIKNKKNFLSLFFVKPCFGNGS